MARAFAAAGLHLLAALVVALAQVDAFVTITPATARSSSTPTGKAAEQFVETSPAALVIAKIKERIFGPPEEPTVVFTCTTMKDYTEVGTCKDIESDACLLSYTTAANGAVQPCFLADGVCKDWQTEFDRNEWGYDGDHPDVLYDHKFYCDDDCADPPRRNSGCVDVDVMCEAASECRPEYVPCEGTCDEVLVKYYPS